MLPVGLDPFESMAASLAQPATVVNVMVDGVADVVMLGLAC